MKRSSLAEGARLVRRLVERLIYVCVGANGNGSASRCHAVLSTLPAAVAAATWFIANVSPRG
jgi:hypothetical protein